MTTELNITIDGKSYKTHELKTIMEAAKDHGIYIPTLCFLEGMESCLGTCRVCTVKTNGHYVAACTWPIQEGDSIEIYTPELIDLRKALVEMLFVEGNHFCPSCEKSGDCDLQALAYKFIMLVPRFPYRFNNRVIDMEASPLIAMEYNRCILCKRCVELIKTEKEEKVFSFQKRGQHVEVQIDPVHGFNLTPALAQKASDICPVGAILYKGKGFDRPIGTRKYDRCPIGYEIDSKK